MYYLKPNNNFLKAKMFCLTKKPPKNKKTKKKNHTPQKNPKNQPKKK